MSIVTDQRFRELLKSREFLGDCYRQHIQLEDAANVIHLSPWHFQREFRQAFGETPHTYLTRLRIDSARQLLATTNLSVLEICLDVGFMSLGSFSSLFKRQTGYTPARYRREVRSTIQVSGIRDLICIPFCFASAFGQPVTE